jgi:hypothetical protein
MTSTIVSGGMLAPGNASNPTGTLTITGNLVFQTDAVYLLTINGASTSNTNVTGGSVTLGGASVQIASGSTVQTGIKYTVLTTSGGTVNGTSSPTVTYGADTGTLSRSKAGSQFVPDDQRWIRRVIVPPRRLGDPYRIN